MSVFVKSLPFNPLFIAAFPAQMVIFAEKEMEELTLTTPALCFSALSLLLLAYTNRFLSYAQVVRTLYKQYKTDKDYLLLGQIENLRLRLRLIKHMQLQGIGSLLMCTVTMLLIYIGCQNWAIVAFALALLMLVFSLSISVWEIFVSVKAIDLHLSELENK